MLHGGFDPGLGAVGQGDQGQAHVFAALAQKRQTVFRARETRLKEDVRRFRPYSDKTNAPALPDHVAEDIVNTVNGLQVYEQQLATTTVEQERLRTNFDGEIRRFKELKGLN